MKFELKDVEVNVLHVMTTKAQAESPLYTSVKLGIDSIADVAASALMDGKSAGEIKQSFFAEGKPRFNKVHEIAVTREYLAKHMITFEGLAEARVTKLWKPELTLLSEGGFGLTISLQLDTPNENYMWLLHHMMHKKVTISLVQDTKDLVDEAEDKAPKQDERRTPRRRQVAEAEGDGAGAAMH